MAIFMIKARKKVVAIYADPRNKINSEINAKKKKVAQNQNPPSTSIPVSEDDKTNAVREKMDKKFTIGGIRDRMTRYNAPKEKQYEWEINYKELRLEEKVGEGNFGEVFRGSWCGSVVAVKTTHQDIAHEVMDRFLSEINLMSALHHPNIVIFMGACITQPNVCLVMEYLSKGCLYDFIHDKDAKIDMALLHRFATDVARGMKYLHIRMHVVQRDLKSRNLLIDDNMNAKLCDFGLSQFVAADNTMTHCGTPSWTAPEIIRQEAFTEKADVYSYAIVLWELITQQDPHEGMEGMEVAFLAAERGLRPTIPSVCPEGYAELMSSCWQDNPDLRPDFSEVLARLYELKKAYNDLHKTFGNHQGGASKLTTPR